MKSIYNTLIDAIAAVIIVSVCLPLFVVKTAMQVVVKVTKCAICVVNKIGRITLVVTLELSDKLIVK